MAGYSLSDFLPLLIILVVVILFVALPLARRTRGNKRRVPRHLHASELGHALSRPEKTNEDEAIHSGGSLVDRGGGLEGETRPLDAREDVAVSVSAPARKNGKPHE